MKPACPGIVRANRPHIGPFASLLGRIGQSGDALDGLTYAYGALSEGGRRALVEAVLQDAERPTEALLALLSVEDEPRLQRQLAGLLHRRLGAERAARLEHDPSGGRARLIQLGLSPVPESLYVAWKNHEIKEIQVESRSDWKSWAPSPGVPAREAVDILAPLLWRHMRAGAPLPRGVERFAGFFSAP